MPLPKPRKHFTSSKREEKELLALRLQLAAGQLVMTRELLLRIVDCLSLSWFGSGVDLFAYNGREDHEKTRDKEIADETTAHMQKWEEWCNSWYRCARPEWMDVIADILIEPPRGWILDEEFALLFLNVAGQFPDKAVKVLAVLFSAPKVHPRLASLIQTLYVNQF